MKTNRIEKVVIMPFKLHTLRKNIFQASLIAMSTAALVACGGGGGGSSKKGAASPPEASFAYPTNAESVVDINKLIDIDFDAGISTDKNALEVQLNGFDLAPFLYNENGTLKNSDDPTIRLFHVQGLLIEGTNKLQLKTSGSAWEEVIFQVDVEEPTPIVNRVEGPNNNCYIIEGQVRKVHTDSEGSSTLSVDFTPSQHAASAPVISNTNTFTQSCFKLDDVAANHQVDSLADFTITAEDSSLDLSNLVIDGVSGKGNKAKTAFAVIGRELESSMAMQLKSSAMDVLSGWAAELFDPNDYVVDVDLITDNDKSTTPEPSIDPDSSMSLQICAELGEYNVTGGSYCQFYITEVKFTGSKAQYPAVTANFNDVDGSLEAVLNADFGTVSATAYLEIYYSKAEADDLLTEPYALIEFNEIELISTASNGSQGANVDVILDVSTNGYHPVNGDLGTKIIAVSLKPWVEQAVGGECIAFTTPNSLTELDGNWKTCDIQSFATDFEFEQNSFHATILNDDSIVINGGISNGGGNGFNLPIGSVVNPLLQEQIPTLKRTVDTLLHKKLFDGYELTAADAAMVAQNRTFAAVNEAAGADAVKVKLDRLGKEGSLDGVNLLVNMLSGIVAKNPNSNAGIIGLAGSSLLDPNAAITATPVVGSYFNIQAESLNASLQITDSDKEDATWVLSENLVNQMIAGVYQTGALNELVVENFESLVVGEFFDSGYAGQKEGGIEIPTVYPTDALRVNFAMPSAPQIKFVNVPGENGEEGFIEMQLKGMEITADVMKDPAQTYAFGCDAACRGLNVGDLTGVNIPNALIAKMDVTARIQLLPDPITQLPSVSISGEDMSVQMYEYETFIDRIYTQPALKCDTNNPTLIGGLLGGCEALGKNLYTRVQFMAALPEMIQEGVGTAVTALLESNVGGIEAPLFDDEKKMNFVMTNFGVNSTDSYMTIGLDVCEEVGVGVIATATNNTCSTESGYDMSDGHVRGVYELTICAKDATWNKVTLACEGPLLVP